MPDNGGFTFCGVPVKNVGLEYSPELSQTYVYRPTTSNIMADTFEAHDGGYYYGHARQPKVFTLKCFYFLKEIRSGLMKNIYDLFRIGKRGKLIFDKRDWLYYEVVITKINSEEMYNHLNGIVTIEATAYNPYGYINGVHYGEESNDIMLNSNLPDSNGEAYSLGGTLPNSAASGTVLELINFGTEPTPLSFGYKGTGTSAPGISMYNQTTNQLLEMYNCTLTSSTYAMYVDAATGKVYTATNVGAYKTPAFYYHKRGFITLVPADKVILHGSLASTGVVTLDTVYAGDPTDLVGRKFSIVNPGQTQGGIGHITAASTSGGITTLTTDFTGTTISENCKLNIYKTNKITLTVPDSGTVGFLDITNYRFS